MVKSFSTTPGQLMEIGLELQTGSYIIKVETELTSDSFRVTKY